MKLTKERLQEIVEDGFLKHGESKDMARIALASLEAEPVVPPELHWEDVCRISPEITIGDAIVYAGAWNACRAAMLQAAPLTGEDTSAELPEPCPRCGCRSSRPNGEHYCHPLAAPPQQEASDD
ncbi:MULTISPECIES: hypothetical protein [Edwardsiella]|uniref:Phage protein n=1 Tax=Edwardsiella anguillarum TaxID=1821960 RepID=A0ABY8S9Z4_9GAMM|nr:MULTISPECIES: hypothetical protein [Edwardsiella]AKR78033.1 hypothetical protein AAZ33_10640 [Edwardsiella sp. LADL05-105]KAB0587644.1 hypothetical protein F7P84_17580 [Edwardsiella anguillarum]WHP82400.1 hypothetical protein MQ095_11340 [Edwardsiella anguillarum]WHP86199.1 hypothetical protein MQ088_11345 [Edwardsiella anguillarum]WHP89997.1 hypothetical protein MQ091_11340 [Edwardsiella anguillarum]